MLVNELEHVKNEHASIMLRGLEGLGKTINVNKTNKTSLHFFITTYMIIQPGHIAIKKIVIIVLLMISLKQ